MRLPSGDQRGVSSRLGPLVSLTAGPPFALTRQQVAVIHALLEVHLRNDVNDGLAVGGDLRIADVANLHDVIHRHGSFGLDLGMQGFAAQQQQRQQQDGLIPYSKACGHTQFLRGVRVHNRLQVEKQGMLPRQDGL